MPCFPLRARLAAGLALPLALAACDGDPAELAREIDAARQGCTEERLRAADEECVRMFETYAEMGTEAMRGYIGAVKSLDRALQRMPPVQLDTAGLGHAFTVPPAGYAPASSPSGGRATTGYDGPGIAPGDRYPRAAPRDDYDAYGRDPYAEPYGDGYDDRYRDYDPYDRYPGYDGYGAYDGYDGYGGYAPYGGGRAPGYGGAYAPYGGAERRYDRGYGYGYDDPYRAERRWQDRRDRMLLPPEQRLRRPWLEDGADAGYRARPQERYHESVRPEPGARGTARPRPRPAGEP